MTWIDYQELRVYFPAKVQLSLKQTWNKNTVMFLKNIAVNYVGKMWESSFKTFDSSSDFMIWHDNSIQLLIICTSDAGVQRNQFLNRFFNSI